MHAAVRGWVAEHAQGTWGSVLEVGSLDINGGIRDLIDTGAYVGIDRVAGPGVDLVMDARNMHGQFDLVLCCETLEHSDDRQALIDALGRLCKPGGTVIVTAAGPGREPHSAVDGGPLRDGEWYENCTSDDLHVSWGEVIDSVIDDGDFRVVWRRYGSN